MSGEPVAWRCKHGHDLGSVRWSETGGGSKVQQLLLYRNAIDMSDEHPDDVDVIAVIEGYVVDVRCNVPGCDAMRTWVPGEAALKRLLDSMRKRRGEPVPQHDFIGG